MRSVLKIRRLKVEFWGKSIYNFAANSQSRGSQKTISKQIPSEFDAKFAPLKSALIALEDTMQGLSHLSALWKKVFFTEKETI